MPLPDHIGRHRVDAVVGTGGFAVVVRAHDETLQDTVAIKVLAEQWADDDEVKQRFVDEARLMRRIGSRYLMAVHDIGELPDGRPYFVMDYANRGTLAGRLASRVATGLDPTSARAIATTLAGGLSALHAAGVVHRDINPNNIFIRDKSASVSARSKRAAATTTMGGGLLNPGEDLLIGDLGLAKDVVQSAAVSVLAGTPGYQAPEQVSPDGVLQPATDTYAATAVMWESITGDPPLGATEIASALPTIDARWRPLFEKGMAVDPGKRFGDMDSWLEAVLRALGERGGAEVTAEQVDITSRAVNPYRGLAAFQPEDANLFFGRESLIETLVERLAKESVLVVGGASGSGKSSLVRAGLIPSVKSGALHDSRRWPVVLFTPRSQPMKELSYQLDRAARGATQRDTRPVTGDDLSEDPRRARAAAETVTDSAGGLLMVIDQFEELFTQTQFRETQETFLEALAEMVDPVDSRVRLILVMRADFYAQSATHPWLAEKINRSQVLVGPMSPTELRRAIEEPARQSGLSVEPELVDAVLRDSTGDAGALPLISHAMAETWRQRQGATMDLDAYQTTGGVAGAISQTAESVYGRFDEDGKQATRRLLLRLVTPGEGSSDTRGTLPLSELYAAEAPAEAPRVAEELTEARLLTADESSITIAHEALIGGWPRLRQWIEDSREDLRTRQRISAAAHEWAEQDRDPDLLYRGTPLNAALEWAQHHRQDLPLQSREFLDASEAAYLRQKSVEEAADRRSRRWRNGAIAVLGTLLVVAVGASVVAFNRSQEADQRLANQLATQAEILTADDPRLALALAVEAASRGADSIEVREALVDGTRALETSAVVPDRSPIDVGDAIAVALHPDGGVAAIGSRENGDIVLVDVNTGEQVGSPFDGHDDSVLAIAFTADGGRMVSAGEDGAVLLWDTTTLAAVPPGVEMGRASDLLWDVAIAPDGLTAVTAGENGVIQRWDLEAAGPLGDPLLDADRDVLSVAYSPSGQHLLSGNGRGELMGWDLTTGTELFPTFNAHESDLWEIVFSPNGELVATASSDGSVRLWDRDGGAVAAPFAGTADDVRGVQFLDDGRILVAGDEHGHLRVWDIGAGEETFVTEVGHGHQITSSAAAPEHGSLVTLGLDHNLIPWSLPRGTMMQMSGHDEGAYGVAVSPDGRLLASGDGAGNIRIFSAEDGATVLGPVRVHDGEVWDVAFSDDSAYVFSGDATGALARLTVAGGDVRRSPDRAHDGAVRSVVVDGGRVISGGDDGRVRVWDAELTTTGDTIAQPANAVTDLALSTGGVLAVADRSGTVTFWDPDNREQTGTPLDADDNAIWGVAWSTDGDLLATASDDWVAHVWDGTSHELMATLTSLPQGASRVGFLNEGRTLVATARDGSVHLFDVMLEREIGAEPNRHSAPAWGLTVFPDGATYATSGEDGLVAIWDELDLDRACQRAEGALDAEQQRRFLGGADEATGCP